MFKRKIYQQMVEWKKLSRGRSALLIQGARRVGKSTVAQEFARREYKSFLLIDFSKARPEVVNLFNDMHDLDFFFLQLQMLFKVRLYLRKSLIIFDEVQLQPLARQAIKHLVADGRYDYLETGSLITLRKNIENILIPSEEETETTIDKKRITVHYGKPHKIKASGDSPRKPFLCDFARNAP